MKIIQKKTEKLLIKELIRIFLKSAKLETKAGNRFSFVLTGGPSPIKLYDLLSKSKIFWNKIDLFWGDERFVSHKSKSSNFRLVHKSLLKRISVNKKNLYPIETNFKNVKIAAKKYAQKIKKYFKNKKLSFDIVLLGMGDDGHIASIFSDNIRAKEKLITNYVKRKDFERISLSLDTINKAKKIFLLLNTKDKTVLFKKFVKRKNHVPVNFLNKKKIYIFQVV